MARRTSLLPYAASVACAAALASFSLRAGELPRTPAADTDLPRQSASVLPGPSASVDPTPSGISGNIAAVNIVTGSGLLGRALGFDADSGVRIGGVWVSNANFLLAGGDKPGQASFNSLLVADLKLDFAKLANFSAGQFHAQFLPPTAPPTHDPAASQT